MEIGKFLKFPAMSNMLLDVLYTREKAVTAENGITNIGGIVFAFGTSSTTSIVTPKSVTTVGKSAIFYLLLKINRAIMNL